MIEHGIEALVTSHMASPKEPAEEKEPHVLSKSKFLVINAACGPSDAAFWFYTDSHL